MLNLPELKKYRLLTDIIQGFNHKTGKVFSPG